MIDAASVKRMLALSAISPFGVLKESELLLVAQQAIPRRFAAGETVFPRGQVADVMVIVLSGSAHAGGQALAPAIGAASILFGLPLEEEIVAGQDGIESVCIAKPHLFTIARECPDFIVGLAALETQEAG